MEKFVNNAPFVLVLVFLLIGFVFLIKGADFFVEGSSSIAKRLKVPSIIIGLTIVAMGTSLPETAVSVTASLVHNNELAVSNVVGSNIFNLMFVIGTCAILTPILVQRATIVRDIPLSLLCALLLLGLGYLAFGDAMGMTLGHLDGIIFLFLFAVYIFTMVRAAMKARAEGEKVELEAVEETEELPVMPYSRSIVCIIGGAAAIAFGGDLTVDAASRIALDLGMSQTLVGLTIVSIGTSLPELVTSVVAARKNEVDMAVGNAVGSNIFNILMVLGIASAISPISLIRENVIDIAVLMAFTVVVWILATTKRKITRAGGITMVAMYLFYSAYIILR
ncbi:calcium/sodium antiporter [Blautia sp. MSJ-19]|uniref:calcium/sodium antiporter n=1 Tax=Blautia sp. MSJ-19 TaxID=2841517 RepID=UPI001C0EAB02|nr:calcium/sodium antiporter [Blautia sp. MSJ-19]MBU5480133.1 calcium/sodium antiporter [Blautia sp. MSJ-19]